MPERRYVDDNPLPEPTGVERERGFIAFTRPYVDLVFEDAVPLPQERFESLEVQLARGEYEPATFAVRALGDLKGVHVSLGEGSLPPAWVEVRVARSMMKRLYALFTEFGRTGDVGTKGDVELMRAPTWLATMETDVKTEMDRISQRLTGRIKELADRYETPLPKQHKDVNELTTKVDTHLKKMGFVWN